MMERSEPAKIERLNTMSRMLVDTVVLSLLCTSNLFADSINFGNAETSAPILDGGHAELGLAKSQAEDSVTGNPSGGWYLANTSGTDSAEGLSPFASVEMFSSSSFPSIGASFGNDASLLDSGSAATTAGLPAMPRLNKMESTATLSDESNFFLDSTTSTSSHQLLSAFLDQPSSGTSSSGSGSLLMSPEEMFERAFPEMGEIPGEGTNEFVNPEPSSVILLGIGAICLFVFARRRTRTATAAK